MKKLIILAAAMLILFGLTACGKGREASTKRTLKQTTAKKESMKTRAAQAAAAKYEKMLTPEDVAGVCGLTGVRCVPKDPSKGAGGDLNFTTADGEPLLLVNFGNKRKFDELKASQYSHGVDIDGLGDAAFSCPSPSLRPDPYGLCFLSKDLAVTINSHLGKPSADGEAPKALLSQDQLKQLAQIIMQRQ